MSAGSDVIVLAVAAVVGVVVLKKIAPSLNPANPNNVINQGANSLTQILTGDPNATVGNKLYDAGIAVGMSPDWGAIAAADTVMDSSTGRVRYLRPGTNSIIAESVIDGSGTTVFYYPGTVELMQ